MAFRALGLLAVISFIAHAKMLVTVDELTRLLTDEHTVVLHVGSEKDYSEGHIPGARLVSLGDLSVTGEGGLRLQLPTTEQLKAALEKLGIGNGTRVVIYPAGESIQSATRVWFTFDYLGLGERAALLDGGLGAWRAAGKEMSTAPAAITPGQLSDLKPNPSLVVDAGWIRGHLADPQFQLIDARTPQYFSGEDRGMMPRAGRIPGARNVPFVSLVDTERKFVPVEEMKTKLALGGKTAVSYCHIGLQATVVYFAARMAGQSVLLYDGSFQDWSQRSELPVEGGN